MATASPPRRPADAPAPVTPPSKSFTTPLLIVAAISATIGFAICIKVWVGSTGATDEDILRIANSQYSSNNRVIAGELAKRAKVPGEALEKVMLRHFLIGAGKAREAKLKDDPSASRAAFHEAAKELRIAAEAWPEGRDDEGDRLLGEVLYHIGEFSSAIPRLQQVIKRNPTYREPLTPILVRCLMRGGDADARLAVEMIDQYNALPGRAGIVDWETRQLAAECLIRLGQFQAARERLTINPATDKVNPDPVRDKQISEETELLLAITIVSEAIRRFGPGSLTEPKPRPEVEKFLSSAMETLVRLQQDGGPAIGHRTGIWIARAMRCMGQLGDALSQLNAIRLYQPFAGEGIAAALEQIEYLVAQGNSSEAVQTARYLIREVGSEANFDASMIDLATFRQRLQQVLSQLREQEETAACVAFARSLPPLFSLDQALYEEGLAYREAGDRLESVVLASRRDRNEGQSAQLRELYAQAGNAFESSSRLRYTSPEYTKTLWEAISSLQKSGQFSRTIPLLNEYVRFEQRIRLPRALIALGRAYLADNQPEAAIKPLIDCVEEFPRDPLCYDARLLAAKAMAERDQLESAQKLLDANLTDGNLTPQSLTWKDSLLTLGEVLWRRCSETHVEKGLLARSRREPHSLEELRANQPLVEEAVARLNEAVVRYWPDPRVMQSATFLARAYRLAAVLPEAESRIPDALDATRRRLLKQRETLLSSAIETYRKIRSEITLIEDERELASSEQSLRQISLLGEADTLYEMGQYERSADAYRTISLRYMNEPPALEAMLGQVRCLRSLNKNREAKLVIRQAVVVLERIPAEWDDRFDSITRYDRGGWKNLLAWLDEGPLPPESDS